MPQWVVAACPASWSLESFTESLTSTGMREAAVLRRTSNQVELTAKDESWNIVVSEVTNPSDAVADYTANDELDERFRGALRGLRFFAVRFQNLDLARRLLRRIAQAAAIRNDDLWIDTDYGWVIHGRDFLRRTDEDPGWDWRYKRDQEN